MSTGTLLHRVAEVARERTDDPEGIRVLRFGSADVTCSVSELLRRSAGFGEELTPVLANAAAERTADRPAGTAVGTPVIIATADPLPAIVALLAALGIGACPLVVPNPTVLGAAESFRARLDLAVRGFGGRCALVIEEPLAAATQLPSVATLPVPTTLGSVPFVGRAPQPRDLGQRETDVAFLQMTSASTGDGTLVGISHRNILANLEGIRQRLQLTRADRLCSWLPLYHDMGLVGAVLNCLVNGLALTIMAPGDFVRRPSRWLRAISDSRATITPSPNFGYDHARHLAKEEELAGVDLSCLRAAVVGAEPVRRATLRQFTDRFAPYGFRPQSFTPSYGLAESTLATTMHPPGVMPHFVTVDPRSLTPGRPVRVLGAGTVADQAPGGPAVAVFSVGRPVPGVSVQLRTEEGAAVDGDGVLGEVFIEGPSVCRSRYELADGELRETHQEQLATGDLAFRVGRDLFVVERKKHVIIRSGRNHLASLLEEQASEILAHPVHNVLVMDLDITDPTSDVCLVLEHFPGAHAVPADQRKALRALELPVDVLLAASGRVIPRTTSGKKKYFLCRQLVRCGSLPIEDTVDLRTA